MDGCGRTASGTAVERPLKRIRQRLARPWMAWLPAMQSQLQVMSCAWSGHHDTRGKIDARKLSGLAWQAVEVYSVGAIRQRNGPQNAHLSHVNCAYSAHYALSNTRLSDYNSLLGQVEAVDENRIIARHAHARQLGMGNADIVDPPAIIGHAAVRAEAPA